MDRIIADLDGKHTSGGTFVALMKHIKATKGTSGEQAMFRLLRKHGYRGPMSLDDFKLKKWYPLKDYIIFLDTIDKEFGPDVLFEMSRSAPKREGVVGWFVKWAISPERITGLAGDYVKNFYDYCEFNGETVSRTCSRLTSHDMCAADVLCRAHTAYYLGTIETTGARNVKCVHDKCELDGHDRGIWTITWD